MALLLKGKKAAKAKADPKEGKGKGGGGVKGLVIFIIVLDLLAAGGFLYLKFVHGKKVRATLTSAERGVEYIERYGLTAVREAAKLQRDRATDVKDPRNPINRAAIDLGVIQNLDVKSPNKRNFPLSRIYDAWYVTVSFTQLEGYAFKDLVTFLKRIESKNSKVQINKVDLGKRDPGEAAKGEIWRPTSMEIRVFKPSSRRQN